MFCEKCGNKLPEGAQFCPQCGSTLNWESSTPKNQNLRHTSQPASATGSVKKLILLLTLAGGTVSVICGIILGTALWLYADKDTSNEKNAPQAETLSSAAPEAKENGEEEKSENTETIESLYTNQEYANVLLEYWEGKKGAVYGFDMDKTAWDDKIGQNPQTSAFEYYYYLQDANGDDKPDLFIASHPADWWIDEYIAEGIYSCPNGTIIAALDRTNDTEFKNNHSFCEGMLLKRAESSGGSIVSYEKLNENGTLEELGSGYWGNNGKFYIDETEVTEEEVNRWNEQYDKPSSAEWTLITAEELQKWGIDMPAPTEISESPVSLPREQVQKMVHLLDELHQSLLMSGDYENNLQNNYDVTDKDLTPAQKAHVLWVYECFYSDPRVTPDPSVAFESRNKARKTDMQTIMAEIFGSATDMDMQQFVTSYVYEQDTEFYYMSDGTGDFGSANATYFDSENGIVTTMENGRLKISGTVMKWLTDGEGYLPYKSFTGYFVPSSGNALNGYCFDQLIIQ